METHSRRAGWEREAAAVPVSGGQERQQERRLRVPLRPRLSLVGVSLSFLSRLAPVKCSSWCPLDLLTPLSFPSIFTALGKAFRPACPAAGLPGKAEGKESNVDNWYVTSKPASLLLLISL